MNDFLTKGVRNFRFPNSTPDRVLYEFTFQEMVHLLMRSIRGYAAKVLKLVHRAVGRILEELNPPINNMVVSLKPEGLVRGHVLLSYRIELFLQEPGEPVPYFHYNRKKSLIIAKNFLDLGYAVDVIANENEKFLPRKEYAFFIDTRMNFVRLASLLPKRCVKILYATTAHPYFHNAAEMNRLMNLQERKHVTLRSRRCMPLQFATAIEYADCVVAQSEFAIKNFQYADKPIYLVPNAIPDVYPWPETKDFDACRSHFLWLGSEGMVHKGLDLVLEAFAEMPQFHLTICGPVAKEKDFERVYYQELYHTPNIHTIGWIDIGSSEFLNLTNHCLGLVYPSCSESNVGSVLTCLHASLIPIVSYESGVDVTGDIGVILHTCSIQEIKEAVCKIAGLPGQELRERSRKAWEFARANHTMDNFQQKFQAVIEKLLANYEK